jgi:hypothetical protein
MQNHSTNCWYEPRGRTSTELGVIRAGQKRSELAFCLQLFVVFLNSPCEETPKTQYEKRIKRKSTYVLLFWCLARYVRHSLTSLSFIFLRNERYVCLCLV